MLSVTQRFAKQNFTEFLFRATAETSSRDIACRNHRFLRTAQALLFPKKKKQEGL
jgi:hypothetical protein